MKYSHRNIFKLDSLEEIDWKNQERGKEYLIIDLDKNGKLTKLFSHRFIMWMDIEKFMCQCDDIKEIKV